MPNALPWEVDLRASRISYSENCMGWEFIRIRSSWSLKCYDRNESISLWMSESDVSMRFLLFS